MSKKVKTTDSITAKLQVLRKEIDDADRLLISAYKKRFKAVEKVGKLKKKAGLPVHQPTRWLEVVEDRVKRAKAAGLSEAFVRKYLKLIHQEAKRIQRSIS